MHSVQLDGCHVDWNSVNHVLFYKDATTHRAFRNIVQKFGVSKVSYQHLFGKCIDVFWHSIILPEKYASIVPNRGESSN